MSSHKCKNNSGGDFAHCAFCGGRIHEDDCKSRKVAGRDCIGQQFHSPLEMESAGYGPATPEQWQEFQDTLNKHNNMNTQKTIRVAVGPRTHIFKPVNNTDTNELESALTTFIKSGSSNGREDLRGECLKLVPKISKAANEHAALEAVVEAANRLREFCRRAAARGDRLSSMDETMAHLIVAKYDGALAGLSAVRKDGK